MFGNTMFLTTSHLKRMNKPLTIIAMVVANKDKLALVKDKLIKLFKATREEEGCLNYVLHQDINESIANWRL